jgi:hypothetical protein
LGNSIVSKLASQPKTYKEGDTYTNEDGTRSIASNIDENGQPRVLVNAATRPTPLPEETSAWDIGGSLFENRELYLGAVLDQELANREAAKQSRPKGLSNDASIFEQWERTYRGADAVDAVVRTALIPADLLFSDMYSPMKDSIQNLFTGRDALADRVDSYIDKGYVEFGEPLRYRESQALSQELKRRGYGDNEFTLHADGNMVGTVFDIANPFNADSLDVFRLDDTKVYGNLTTGKDGKLRDDTYDFWDQNKNGKWTLEQPIPKYTSTENIFKTTFDIGKTYLRNQLNYVAEPQHREMSTFNTSFKYTPEELMNVKK